MQSETTGCAAHGRLIRPILFTTSLVQVLERFRQDKNETFFPVIDDQDLPLGLIREQNLKEYVYSPFGREILKRHKLLDFLTPCQSIDADLVLDEALRILGAHPQQEGFLLVRDGKYAGFLDNRSVLEMYEKHRQAVQAQLGAMQKVQAVGTLAGGVSHELNNILMPILGFTELALGKLKENDPLRPLLERVLSSAERAGDIVQQILTFSRTRKDDQHGIRMTGVVKDALELLRATLPRTLDIRFQGFSGDDRLRGNANQLQQVLVNLVTNAYHAIGDRDGRVDILLEERSLPSELRSPSDEFADSPHLYLGVRDTGCGMAPEILQRIFEPFFTTKPAGKGSGLGLAVVHGIVSAHHGMVRAESRPGAGTHFHIYLPRLDGGAEALEKESPPVCPGGGETILLVDDEAAILECGRLALENCGYRVVTETDGERAFDLFAENPAQFDLLITDQVMPKMSGSSLARRVLLLRPDLPIIFCTGFSRALVRREVRRLGARDLLHKPFKQEALCATVGRVLGRVAGSAPVLAAEG